MRTVGVDLAAEPTNTAVAIVDWSGGTATVVSVRVGQDDDHVLAAISEATRVGLDCPLGWPDPFIDFLIAQRGGSVSAPTDLAGRRLLAYRETDRAVTALTGLRPLSVAADRIGHAAMRAAGILAKLAESGQPVDRGGDGLVVEAYPAAALKQWGFPHSGYKQGRNLEVLERQVDALRRRLPGLDLADHATLCRRSDDAFDAVVCALIARSAALGKVCRPDSRQAELARTEGWIVVPTCELTALVG